MIVMKIKKADEIEMYISYRAARLSYLFVTISLVIWMIIDFAINKEFPFAQFLIVAVQNIIFFGSKIFMMYKMTSDKDE